MYLVLTRTNRAIEQAQDGPALLKGACEVIVEVGGFLMSWVGVVDRQDLVVRPVGCAGHDDGYLDLLKIRLEGDRSEGPTGQAVRLRDTVVCDDISTDPRMKPWREEALRRGYRSSIGLPLMKADALFGVLTIYSEQPDRFDAAEIGLLEELARDVSHGLATLEDAAEHRRAEAALTASETRFRATAETLIDPFVILRAVRDDAGQIVDFVYEFANEAACLANRVAREELVGRRILDLLPEHRSAGLIELYARTVETGEPLVLDDFGYTDSWGGDRMDRFFDVRASKLGDAIAYTWRDVTERRAAERRRSEELEQRVSERTAELEAARERATEVARFSAAMLSVADRTEVGEALLETVARVSGALEGLVALVEPQTEKLTDIGSFGFPRDALERGTASPSSIRTPIRDATRAAQPMVIQDAHAFTKRYGKLASMVLQGEDRSRVAFPIRTADANIGGVTLGFELRGFDENELDFFMSLANAAAHALERMRLSEAEREARGMLDTVVAQMPVGVTIAGRDGRPLYRNAALDRIMLGREVAGPADGAWTGLHPDGSRRGPGDWPEARSMATGELVVNEEIRVVRADGTAAVIMQTSAPVIDAANEIVGAVVVTLDVTERKEAEQLRDAFLGVLSHELRTPVTTIYGAAQYLMARGERLDPDVRTELAGDIAAESERLDRMVDDLLVLARAERGMDLTAHGAALVQHRLRAVVASLAAAWPDRRFSCEIPEGVPPVTGDEAYLEHVLRNLLGNAAKYGKRDITAQVTVRSDTVTVTVLDDGPGVDPDQQERIFDLFTRAKATSRLPGAGIGLFVVRRLVEAMGGRVTVANRPEGGAAFTVTLPRYVEPAES
jgi:signal transduction histidine kinase/putative methionine-R-sulfoxide reductase with GAF domain